MRSSKLPLLFLLLTLCSGCSGSGSSAATTSATSGTSTGTDTGTSTTITTTGTSTGTTSTGTGGSTSTGTTTTSSSSVNLLSITVNGSLCSNSSYPNKPCVSLTICTPGSSSCQTISDILLDTGSYGLRIFSQALTVPLTQVASASGSLAECVQFGDGSSLWGPVQTADVFMGGEPAVQLPIQLVNASFGSPPAACRNADSSPGIAGFNGILGVGLFSHDCGSACSSRTNNGMYFSCSGTVCSATTAALTDQVQNPVALLPLDNNGVIVQLPTISTGGSPTASGALILGIGTRSNNSPTSVTAYPADQYAEFTTTLGGISYSSSFLDTGSNGLFFPSPSPTLLPDCSSSYSDWFCPASSTAFSATTSGYGGTPSTGVSFSIANAINLFSSSNSVFPELGGSMTGGFDWGLPFFLGRNVYIGIDGMSSSLGTGPYWAY